jgi:hypothetical protein
MENCMPVIAEWTAEELPMESPYVLQWDSLNRPLPRRLFRRPATFSSALFDPPPYWESGPADRPFDICGHLNRLSAAVVHTCDDLRHIDLSRVLITVTSARSRRPSGLQARVTPLRFHGGSPIQRQRSQHYQVQRHVVDGREILYLMTFCLPRFLDLDFDEKFITLFHELFHIGPKFDGDLRRHSGRYHVHSHSKTKYDEEMAGLVRTYLSNGADAAVHSFLRLNTAQLLHRHGSIIGVTLPRPKILPLPRRAAPTEY